VIDRVFGVDFSGAESAGDKIWIAEARIDGRRIRVASCRPAALLPGSGRKRAQCLEALVDFIAAQRNSVVGCDFPFSLPSSMIDARDWRAFALDFADRFGTADDFLGDCRRRGIGRELRRDCDRESRVPFAAYNLRIYRQTYHGIRDFLAPLVRDRRAVVLPMERPQGALPWVIETCPASTLKHADLYPPYKGRGDDARAARVAILHGLVRRKLLAPLPPALRRLSIENAGGDALDSIIAAAATARAYLAGTFALGCSAMERLEGRVYF